MSAAALIGVGLIIFVLAWFQPQKLFLNKTVARIAEDTDAFALDPATYDPDHPERKPVDGIVKLAVTTNLLDDHLPRVLAALRISSDELAAVRGHAPNCGPDSPRAVRPAR